MSGMKIKTVVLFVCLLAAATAKAYTYDPNDFATQVVEYVQGTDAGTVTDWITQQPFTNPSSALGRPTVDTTGDNLNIQTSMHVPVVPVYAPFRSFELVIIGYGGHLTLKFSHRVEDDENNPYGIDFIVFGNGFYGVKNSAGQPCYWTNGNPNNYFISGSSLAVDKPAIVSVSQDGIHFYRYANGPYADSFPPTLGRIYDTSNPDTSIGSWNLWWGQPTDPTFPLDPNLTASHFANMSVAAVAQFYGQSAGGAGFDIEKLAPADYAALATDPNTGRKWIQYVRIDTNSLMPEVDAVADVSCCGDWKHPFPKGDITHDCVVDYYDLAVLAGHWLHQVTGPNDPAATADIYKDNIINFKDWAIMARNWNACTWQCE